ncbi:MAG: D-2-hydroxyacid dehydrogenase [Epulopiscium sp.]|nr:D-2-hydroxyacid dehydrogenase [Candidatus Epulonipiscium sp.]
MNLVTSLSFGEEHLKRLKNNFKSVNIYMYNNIEEAKEKLYDADVFVTYGFDMTNKLIEKMERLKWIQCFSTGIDVLPLDKIKEKGILLTNVRGIHGIPIAEYVMAVILNYRIEAFKFYEQQKNKIWKRKSDLEEVYNKAITIIGTGTIGKEIARKAKAFDMRTIGVNTNGRNVDYFDEIYSNSELNYALSKGDYIVQTVPLTKSTYKMLGKEQFESMKATAFFINIARGKTVDEKVLIEALNNNIIKAAAIDVFEIEPLPKESSLWAMENVFITPHISGLSNMYINRAIPILEHNLKAYLQKCGKYINMIDFNKKY